jgi:hypothetical protein
MTLHFAYGSNMSRAVMRKHAPFAKPIGVATLVNYRFLITTDGYASVAPRRGERVHGVLGGSRRAISSRLRRGRTLPAVFTALKWSRCGMPAGKTGRWSIWRGRAPWAVPRADTWNFWLPRR